VRLTKTKLDRDGFIEALASWMRWRGHSIPHNMLSQRFPLSSGEVTLSALQKAARTIGVHLTFKKRGKVLPKPENFPLIALMSDGAVSAR
jgi:ABC-type bacteriocin/lantibiotic exporter with double-glycine peptidase domain